MIVGLAELLVSTSTAADALDEDVDEEDEEQGDDEDGDTDADDHADVELVDVQHARASVVGAAYHHLSRHIDMYTVSHSAFMIITL